MSRPTRNSGTLTIFILALLVGTGCGGGAPQREARSDGSVERLKKNSGGAGVAQDAAPAAAPQVGAAPAQPPAGAAAAPPIVKQAPVDRKIIYTAKLDIVVKDLEEATREVDKRLAANKGRLVRSELRSDTGARRTATFTLEVPVESFRDLVGALKELGTPEHDSVDSQDVTEEFVDVQARLKNLRQQEDKLNELLKERRKEEKLEDVIRVSEKIYEVRQVIERVEGRLKYLETKAAFSTVNLTLREIKDYKPPTTPTFGNRVSRTFADSWDAVGQFAEWVAIAAVAVVPWLPILIPIGLLGYVLLRKAVRWINNPAPVLAPRWPGSVQGEPDQASGEVPHQPRGSEAEPPTSD